MAANEKANLFKDAEDSWAVGDIGYMAENHFMGGYPDGTFKGDHALTRGEMASTLNRVLRVKPGGRHSFSDVSGHWSASDIYATASAGIVAGYPDGSFGPDRHITRAETVAMLNRAYQRVVAEDILENQRSLKTFRDLLPSHWAYKELISAANDVDLAAANQPAQPDDEEKPNDGKEENGNDKRDEHRPDKGGNAGHTGGNTKPKPQTLVGYAHVDSRNYPSVSPFIHPPFYNAVVEVVVDGTGKIQSVTDHGTGESALSLEDPAKRTSWQGKNGSYWGVAATVDTFGKFNGKTLEDVKTMDFSKTGADVVSGATASGEAIQEAVVNAMEKRDGLKFLVLDDGKIKAMDATVNGKVVTFSENLPEDFDIAWVSLTHGATNTNPLPTSTYTYDKTANQLTFASELTPGEYFANIQDASKTYRPPHFEAGKGEEDLSQAVTFVVDSIAVAAANETDNGVAVTNNELANYLANLEHMKVTEKDTEGAKTATFETLGHHGTVSYTVLLDDEGRINADLANRQGPVFVPGKTYTVEVDAFGYNAVTIDYTVPGGTTPPEEQPDSEPEAPALTTKYGKATVDEPFNYDVNVVVTLDAEGIIQSVADHETNAGANAGFFNKATAMFPKYVGKTLAELESATPDAVSGATLTSTAISKAVIAALEGT